MPQQLIYTSAPRGVVAGRSGYCTVARSASMREALVLKLEQLSYYNHLSLSGGEDCPIACHRVVDIRGTRFHVLSRLRDAGLDFTGRTNFIAHHLALTPEETLELPNPAMLLAQWDGWMEAWEGEPELYNSEDWSTLSAAPAKPLLPAIAWKRLTGDSANAYGLLEAAAGSCFRAENLSEPALLGLIAESLELAETKDPRRDARTARWQYTFTTFLQEQDNPADFRWRCVHTGSPAFAKLGAAECKLVTEARAARCTAEEAGLARNGKQAPRFKVEPEDRKITEGQPLKLQAEAEGFPEPTYQWYAVSRSGLEEMLQGQTTGVLALKSTSVGVSRYLVKATNSAGAAASRTAQVSTEAGAQELRIPSPAPRPSPMPNQPAYVKSEEEIDRQRRRLESQEAEALFYRRRARNKILAVIGAVAAVVIVAVALIFLFFVGKPVAQKASEPASNSPPLLAKAPLEDTAEANPQNTLSKPTVQTNESPLASGQSTNSSSTAASGGWKEICIGLPGTIVTNWPPNTGRPIFGVGSGFSGSSDEFKFVYEHAGQPTEFRARLSENGRTENSAVGIMLRLNESEKSPFVFVGVIGSNIGQMTRDKPGAASETMTGAPCVAPVYLKIGRNGSAFRCFYSKDGSQWEAIGNSFNLDAAGDDLLAGFALASGKKAATIRVIFDQESLETLSNH